MAQPIAPDYGQQFLFPPALEDWVPLDHPARFLREFVDQLDLAALGFVMPSGAEGRPPYAPSLFVKIWLYGYFHRIRATRRLETACREVLPLVWLTGLLAPDHNSLWRFWRDNTKALRALFQQSVHLALRTGCVGLVLQALDGTKIQAAASTAAGWNQAQMEKLLAALDAALEETELKIVTENADLDAPMSAVALPAGLAERKALRAEIQKALAQLAADGRAHYHPVEPEARRMQLRDQNRFAYNAQAVADEQEGVIVACEVTRHENDAGQLAPMIQQARENLGVAATETLTVADAGYGAGADVAAAAEQELPVLVTPAEGTPARDNPYAAQHFTYDPQQHTVTCPRGERLDYEGQTHKKGLLAQRFRCHCRDCPVRPQCTRDPKGRQIEVWPHTVAVQAMRARLQDSVAQALLDRRGEIIEPRFGQIKQHEGFRRWTVWGLDNVRTQWALLCATLNLRVIYRRWRAGRSEGGSSSGGLLAALAGWAGWIKKAVVRRGVDFLWACRPQNYSSLAAAHRACLPYSVKYFWDSLGVTRPTSELREDAPEYRVAAVGRPPQTSADSQKDQRRSAETPLRFIDLFCGIGGFRIAFERAGGECVFSSDWNEMAQITYEANFHERPHGDIYSVPDNAIPPHHILCAGFPCQPFSIAGVSKKLSLGKKHGFEDKEQGNLFFKLAELIDHHRPDAFVLENVKHLTRHDQGRTFRIIHETLTEHLKYHVHHRVMDARSVVPQHRERIFLVGFRERRAFEFPEFPAEGPRLYANI